MKAIRNGIVDIANRPASNNMTIKISIPLGATIAEGQEILTFCMQDVKIGDSVHIARILGNPIADGKITSCMGDDPKAPVTPSKKGKMKNAWRNYYKILVEHIY